MILWFIAGFVVGSTGGVLGAAMLFAGHSSDVDDDPEDFFGEREG